jgi:hypothetical protein
MLRSDPLARYLYFATKPPHLLLKEWVTRWWGLSGW